MVTLADGFRWECVYCRKTYTTMEFQRLDRVQGRSVLWRRCTCDRAISASAACTEGAIFHRAKHRKG